MSTRKHWREPRRWTRPGWRSAGHLRPSGWGRRWISRGSPPRTPRARRMPNRKGDPDVRPIQAIQKMNQTPDQLHADLMADTVAFPALVQKGARGPKKARENKSLRGEY